MSSLTPSLRTRMRRKAAPTALLAGEERTSRPSSILGNAGSLFLRGHRVLIRMNNTTTVAYINRQGGLRSHGVQIDALKLRLLPLPEGGLQGHTDVRAMALAYSNQGFLQAHLTLELGHFVGFVQGAGGVGDVRVWLI